MAGCEDQPVVFPTGVGVNRGWPIGLDRYRIVAVATLSAPAIVGALFISGGGLVLQLIRDAWAGLDNVGRVTLIICLTLVIIAAIAYQVDLRPWL